MKSKIVFLILLHIFLLYNLAFIPWPENLTWPYFNLSGMQYYKDIFILYPPLYWLSLSTWYRIFTPNIFSLQIFSYLIIILSDIALYFSADKKILPVLLYIPLQIFFEGNGVWVDHLLVPFFLLSYYFLKRENYFATGIAIGLAFMTKQTAVYFTATIVTFVLINKFRRANFTRLAFGLVISIFIIGIYLIATHSAAEFFDQAVVYILTFHTKHPLQSQLPNLRQLAVSFVVFAPIIFIFKSNRLLFFITITSAMGIFTRFEYFHLQPALPFVAIALSQKPKLILSYLIFLFAFLKFSISTWHKEPRFFDKNLYANVAVLQKYDLTKKKILVLNTWDQYYFLLNKLPAWNFFVPSTPWTMDFPGNQERIIANIEKFKPLIVYNDCFLVKNICYKPKMIEEIIKNNYTEISKLSDGTGIFEYNPMRLP